MNRRRTIKFSLLAATALTLAACGEAKQDALTYDSVESCINAGQQSADVCRSEFAKAQQRHKEVAPRYADERACYSEFGQNRCTQQRTSSGSFWLPFMVGYMLAPRGGFGSVYSQPLYRTRSNPGGFTTAGGGQVGAVSPDGRSKVAKSQVSQPRARTRTVARGGFGARARSAGS